MPIENRDRIIQVILPLQWATALRQEAESDGISISMLVRQRLELLEAVGRKPVGKALLEEVKRENENGHE